MANGTFERIVVYDWQGWCKMSVTLPNDATMLLTPFRMILLGMKFMFGQLLWTLSKINSFIGVLSIEVYDENYENNDAGEIGGNPVTQRVRPLRKGQNQEEEDYFNRVIEHREESIYYACDIEYELYDLEEQNLDKNSALDRMHTNCST